MKMQLELLKHRRLLTSIDFNLDGWVDVSDVDLLTVAVAKAEFSSELDVDTNGILDIQDIDLWLQWAAERNGLIEPYPVGDSNLDGRVDSEDLNEVGVHWQVDELLWSKGNFNADSRVDSVDLNLLAVNWQVQVYPVPKPDSLSSSVTSEPTEFATGDFNNDGIIDVATTNIFDELTISLGRGDGSFELVHEYTFHGRLLQVADFNGDEILDLLATNSLALGNGDGSFGEPIVRSNGRGTVESLASGDFNGDGIRDIVSYSFAQLGVELGNGDGTIQDEWLPLPNNGLTTFIEPIDVNGDGLLDLVVPISGGFATQLNEGNADFTLVEHQFELPGSRLRWPVVADISGDGSLDVVIAVNRHFTFVYAAGLGDGTFSEPTKFFAGRWPTGISAGDFNSDGVIDLVTSNGDGAYFHLADGRGGFNRQQILVVPGRGSSEVRAVTTEDLNNDGIDDALILKRNGFVSAYLGTEDATQAAERNNRAIARAEGIDRRQLSWPTA